MLLVLVALISTPLAAQYPAPQIRPFVTGGHEVYAYCPKTGFYAIEMWIWCQPGPNGMICAEFCVDYPYNIIQTIVTTNMDIYSVSIGDLVSGISVCYKQCLYDWHWIYHQTLYVTDPSPGAVMIVQHPEASMLQVANCLGGYPLEEAISWIGLYYNDPCPPEP
jgi:hypothetical protein